VPTVDLSDVDLFVRGEHHTALRSLRATDPVYQCRGAEGREFWALTRYEDVLWAYRNHEVFGSSRGAIVGGSFRSDNDTSAGQMLVSSDLPRHRLLKQRILPGLSSAVADRVAAQVSVLVDRALDRMVGAGGGDVSSELATELPAAALMVVMGIDYTEAHELIGLTRRMVGYRDDFFVDTSLGVTVRLAWLQAEVFEFFAGIVSRRRQDPGEDLISRLLFSKIDGRSLSQEEVFYNCMNVAVGGNETSSYTVCSGLLALMDHPEQFGRLVGSPELLPSAMDEILRWSSTNAYVQRVAKQDVERRGKHIHEGDLVTLWNVSANRDEDEFDRPGTFDVARSPNRHLAYGSGLHRCVGAPIAQAEMQTFFSKLLAAGIRLELAGDVRPLRSNFILGIAQLPVAMTR